MQTDLPHLEKVENFTEKLDDRTLLGQLFMLGYDGSAPNHALLQWIRNRSLGGVKIFGWNAKNAKTIKNMITIYQKAALTKTPWGLPLLIATDQEGGNVQHVKAGTTKLPSAFSLGATGYYQYAYQAGSIIGKELYELGINMNFAPNLDLYVNPLSSIVATRAFHQEPEKVAMMSLAFYQGLEANKIISTAKHFPGHGRSQLDSHGILPRISGTLEELKNSDLLPYHILVQEKVPSIMVGHLAFPDITKDSNLPSSRSKLFLIDLLRNEWGYEGVVISDDMNMSGATSYNLTETEVSYQSIKNGVDILLFTRPSAALTRVWNTLFKRMQSEPEFRMRVKEAAMRVISLKMQYLDNQNVLIENLKPNLPIKANEEKALELTFHSLRIKDDILWNTINEKPLFIIAPYNEIGRSKNTFLKGSKFYPIPYGRLSHSVVNKTIKAGRDAVASGFRLVVYVPYNHIYKLLENWKDLADDLVIVSTQKPTLVEETSWIKRVLYLYTDNNSDIRLSLSVLSGEIPRETIQTWQK